MTASQSNPRPLVRAELVRLLDSLEHHLPPLLVVAAGTGVRFSEVAGVRWSDVEVKRGTLAVPRREDDTRKEERRASKGHGAEPGEDR